MGITRDDVWTARLDTAGLTAEAAVLRSDGSAVRGSAADAKAAYSAVSPATYVGPGDGAVWSALSPVEATAGVYADHLDAIAAAYDACAADAAAIKSRGESLCQRVDAWNAWTNPYEMWRTGPVLGPDLLRDVVNLTGIVGHNNFLAEEKAHEAELLLLVATNAVLAQEFSDTATHLAAAITAQCPAPPQSGYRSPIGWVLGQFGFLEWLDFDPNSPVPTEDINPDEAMDDDTFVSGNLSQYAFGDCWFVASLMSVVESDDGDAWIKENVAWDEQAKLFHVTLYPPYHAPVVVDVDKFYHQSGGTYIQRPFWFDTNKQGIVSIYEAALAKYYGFDALNSGLSPARALWLITGNKGYSAASDDPRVLQAAARVSAGEPTLVVTGTQPGWLRQDCSCDSSGEPAYDKTKTILAAKTSRGPSTSRVTLVSWHAYEVIGYDASTGRIGLRNPARKAVVGTITSPDTFWISVKQFEDNFPFATINQIPQ